MALYETQVTIGGVLYQKDRIISLRIYGGLYSSDTPGVGGCEGRQIDLNILPSQNIPRMAKIEVYTRDLEATNSELKRVGVFFIDTRRRNWENNSLQIHGYDAILKMDRYLWRALPSDLGDFTWNSVNVMSRIAGYMEVELDTSGVWSGDIYDPEADKDEEEEEPTEGQETTGSGSESTTNEGTSGEGTSTTEGGEGDSSEPGSESGETEEETEPENVWHGLKLRNLLLLTMRTVARHIAAASGGNWMIDRNGRLILRKFELTGPAYTLNLEVGSYWLEFDTPAWTGVKLKYNGMEDAIAGDESGRVAVAECPFATVEIATSILSMLRQEITYYPFEASGALIPPWAQLGDTVYVGDPRYEASWQPHPLGRMDTDFDGLCASTISAPDDGEYSREFPPEDSGSLEDIIRDLLNSAGLTVKLRVIYKYNTTKIYEEVYQYADGYEFNLATIYPDVSSDTRRRVFRPQVSTITGIMDGDTTVEVPCDLALDFTFSNSVLAVYDVDGATMPEEIIIIS